MDELLAWIARQLVDDPDAVSVETVERDDATVLRLHVAPDDVGKVIGRQGRLVRALRTVVRACGARLIGYFFDVSTRAAIARNQQRAGRARVPPVAVFTTARRLEPPTRDEGFDELYRVTLDEDHGPVVAAL